MNSDDATKDKKRNTHSLQRLLPVSAPQSTNLILTTNLSPLFPLHMDKKLQIREIQALGATSAPPNNYLSSEEHPSHCHLGSTSWIKFK